MAADQWHPAFGKIHTTTCHQASERRTAVVAVSLEFRLWSSAQLQVSSTLLPFKHSTRNSRSKQATQQRKIHVVVFNDITSESKNFKSGVALFCGGYGRVTGENRPHLQQTCLNPELFCDNLLAPSHEQTSLASFPDSNSTIPTCGILWNSFRKCQFEKVGIPRNPQKLHLDVGSSHELQSRASPQEACH